MEMCGRYEWKKWYIRKRKDAGENGSWMEVVKDETEHRKLELEKTEQDEIELKYGRSNYIDVGKCNDR